MDDGRPEVTFPAVVASTGRIDKGRHGVLVVLRSADGTLAAMRPSQQAALLYVAMKLQSCASIATR